MLKDILSMILFINQEAQFFFYLGGEGPAEDFLIEVQMFTWCQQFNAMYIIIEHRYYGVSSPTPNYSTENLKYLSSEQALADAAFFLQEYNKTLHNPGPWVIFGCSYSGCLSSWFRQRYPDLVIGGYGPSGPVEAQTDFPMYMGQFQLSAGPVCADATAQAVDAIKKMIPQNLTGLGMMFNSCYPIENRHLYYFKYVISEQLAGQAQEDLPPDFPLSQICEILTGPGEPVSKFAQAFAFGGTTGCNDFNQDDMIKQMRKTNIKENYNGARCWMYQSCMEFGYFQTSYKNTSVFFQDLHLDTQLEWCGKIFELPTMVPNTNLTNQIYGGKDHLNATMLAITQGLIDPWHNLGITESYGGISAFTYESGHCAPLHQTTSVDPPSLTEARASVTDFLIQLLNNTIY